MHCMFLPFASTAVFFATLGSVFTCLPNAAFLHGILSVETYAQSFKLITVSLKAS